jgi:membrane protein
MIRFISNCIQRARKYRLSQAAGSLAFLTVLAIVPVISVALAALSVLEQFDPLRKYLLAFLQKGLLLPSFGNIVMNYVEQFSQQATALSLWSAALFFSSALLSLITIDSTFNQIWGVSRPRGFFHRGLLYMGVLVIAPFVIAASLAVNAMLFGDWLRWGAQSSWQAGALSALPWLGTALVIFLLFRYVPNTKVPWQAALLGTSIAIVGLALLRWGFAKYLSLVPTLKVVYGAFATVPLFLIWVYLAWWVLLIAALVASQLKTAASR